MSLDQFHRTTGTKAWGSRIFLSIASYFGVIILLLILADLLCPEGGDNGCGGGVLGVAGLITVMIAAVMMGVLRVISGLMPLWIFVYFGYRLYNTWINKPPSHQMPSESSTTKPPFADQREADDRANEYLNGDTSTEQVLAPLPPTKVPPGRRANPHTDDTGDILP